jgi:nucleoid DNA-binding protein
MVKNKEFIKNGNRKLYKRLLIRTIAKRASFTIEDIKIIWKTFEEIIKEIISEKSELIVPGLFKLYIKKIEEHKGWDAVRNQPLDISESYRIIFRPSRRLLNLLKK